MSESLDDNWPMPLFNPGTRDHLHALGVISITFSAFERSIDDLYAIHPRQERLPDKLIEMFYFGLSEEARVIAIREVFAIYEKDSAIIAAVNNVLDYFVWCRDARNKLLHAEHYPALFGGQPETLYLIKRVGKKNPKPAYMALKLSELRLIAENFRHGVARSAELSLKIRYRHVPPKEVPASIRPYVEAPVPDPLKIPNRIELSSSPVY